MQRQPDEPEINLDQFLESIRSFFRRLPFGGGGGGGGGRSTFAYIVFGIVILSGAIWLATGFYTIQPGERSVMRQFGTFKTEEDPGLHWFWPAPIGTKAIVNVDEIRRLELGFRGGTSVPIESIMITGDENIVDAQLLVQYNIKDPRDFLFRAVDPDGLTIKDAAETALRQVVGARNIDDVLTTEKEAVQSDTADVLQRLLDLYQTGINVTEVKLQNVRPPVQVRDAFDDVVKAREDKDRIINLAEAYEADVLPKARGQAARLLEGAVAFKAERVAKATGESQRFLKVLEEFQKSRNVTRQRLYLEAMEEILPGITKFIVDGDSGGNLLQFLPLTQQSTAESAGFTSP